MARRHRGTKAAIWAARAERAIRSLAQEGRSVREQAPLQDRFRESAGARRSGIELEAGVRRRWHNGASRESAREIRLEHKQIGLVARRRSSLGGGRDERSCSRAARLGRLFLRLGMAGADSWACDAATVAIRTPGQRAMIRGHEPATIVTSTMTTADKLRCAAGSHGIFRLTRHALFKLCSRPVPRREPLPELLAS